LVINSNPINGKILLNPTALDQDKPRVLHFASRKKG